MRKTLFTVLALAISILTFSSPIDSLENALKSAKGEAKVKIYNELFRAYINSDPVRAIGYTREGLALAIEISDMKGMAASYNNIGVSYRNQGALDKSLENYLLSLRIYDSLKNVEGTATTKNNIGTIYSLKKDYSQALKYFEESFAQFTQMNDTQKVIGSLNNLGNIHSDLQLYEQALKFYSQAMEMTEKTGKIFSDPLNNIGNLFFKQGNYQKAIDYYKKALALAKKENNQINVINIMTNMGEVFSKTGQTAKAQACLDSALRYCKDLQVYVYEPQILKNLAGNFAKQGKTKDAYETMLSYDKAKDRIYGEESTRKIAQMEMALDLQSKEKEVEALKMDATIRSMELKNTRMVITIVVLVVIAAISLFNLFLARKKSGTVG
ncbi:MAG TPA: tetratricopeptide repeat protein [Cyclobacteriaceae bacterium]|nr:tetratricopeptide repeat protein [Cyclobacteriaceae bacterium]